MSDETPRAAMETDIVCVGFGPAAGGFLTTLTRGLMNDDGTPVVESKVMPGMAPQVICYERADDIGFGVSGVVTKGRSIKASFPGSRSVPDSHGPRGHGREDPLPQGPGWCQSSSVGLFKHGRQGAWQVGWKTMPMNSLISRHFWRKHPGMILFHRPAQPMGWRKSDGDRYGADMAFQPRGRAAHGRQDRQGRAHG